MELLALTDEPAPEAAGFDPRRLAAIDALFLDLVQRGRLPGAVALVMRRGRLAHFNALGMQDPVTAAPMRRDSIFRIYSMTKPIVSVAAMMLFEQGRLLLSDPVAKYLPEFAPAQVYVEAEGGPQRVAPVRPMTVQDLLRHTAGFTYEFLEPSPVRRLYAEAGILSQARSNAEHAQLLAGLPLMHQPGSVWDYSRATDILGRLVEVVAGDTLGAHLGRTIFEPLGMSDTGFHIPDDRHERIAEPFATDPDSGERRPYRPTSAGPLRSNRAAAGSRRPRSTTRASCRCCCMAAPSAPPACSVARRSST